jgi:2-polyprenyl-6-methoxyphenol hydroxylase-like FAD-dependent oxidoreductase
MIDVLVAGAGPCGLMMGSELRRRGVHARVIDKAATPTTQSRAIGVHARTLEILSDLGGADDLVARGMKVKGAAMRSGTQLLASVDFSGLDTRFPYILCVSQVETEAVLASLLTKHGGSVERTKELATLEQDDDGVTARLADGETIRARFVVGCDGAHSAVRHAIGASFEGHAYPETFVLADVKIMGDFPEEARDVVATWFHEEGVVAVFPLRGERGRLIVTHGEALGDAPTAAGLSALVTKRVGRDVRLEDATWIAPFKIHCRQVGAYRDRRVFLAGDAAHIHSPVGGQGMNTGLQDAHNLAWKLALVCQRAADESILDSYQEERHVIAKSVLTQTDFATKAGTLTGLLAPLRNQVMRFVAGFEPVRRQIAHEASELRVGYPKSPIVEEHGKPRVRAGARLPDELVVAGGREVWLSSLVDGRFATVLAVCCDVPEIPPRLRERMRALTVTVKDGSHFSSPSLSVVRPDLYVGFASAPGDPRALLRWLDTIYR